MGDRWNVSLTDGPNKNGSDRIVIFHQVVRHSICYSNMSSARYNVEFLFEGQRFESRMLRKFIRDYLATMTDMEQVTISIKWEVIYMGFPTAYSHLTLVHYKVQIKIMHISTVNILDIVIGKHSYSIKYEVVYWLRLACSYLTLTCFKCQGHVYFNSEYLENGNRGQILLLQSNRQSLIGFQLSNLYLTDQFQTTISWKW